MQALITRPIEDAGPLAAALAARGVTPVSEPLLAIRPRPAAAVALAGVQAVLFTSANGVRTFGRMAARRDLAVLAVGDAAILPDASPPPASASAVSRSMMPSRSPR